MIEMIIMLIAVCICVGVYSAVIIIGSIVGRYGRFDD
jgi:hypothetical protein